jgi:hypothetical protein
MNASSIKRWRASCASPNPVSNSVKVFFGKSLLFEPASSFLLQAGNFRVMKFNLNKTST